MSQMANHIITVEYSYMMMIKKKTYKIYYYLRFVYKTKK